MQYNPQQPGQPEQPGQSGQNSPWQQQSLPQQPLAPQWSTSQSPSPQQPAEGTFQPSAPLQSAPPQMYPPQSYPAQNPIQPWQQQPVPANQGQQMYAPQMQQQPPMYPYPPAPQIVMPQQVVNVNIQQKQHGLFVRALYFIFIGCWAGWIWLNIGYFFVLTVIGLPLGLMMLNRLPTVLTLKPASQSINISVTGNTTNINISGAQQVNFFIRALYFLFVGWWAGLAWSYIAYVMFVFILTIPIGVMMLNMLPTVITLRKH